MSKRAAKTTVNDSCTGLVRDPLGLYSARGCQMPHPSTIECSDVMVLCPMWLALTWLPTTALRCDGSESFIFDSLRADRVLPPLCVHCAVSVDGSNGYVTEAPPWATGQGPSAICYACAGEQEIEGDAAANTGGLAFFDVSAPADEWPR